MFIDEEKSWRTLFDELREPASVYRGNFDRLLSAKKAQKLFEAFLWEENLQNLLWFYKIFFYFKSASFLIRQSQVEAVAYISGKNSPLHFLQREIY
jgi:hypothetical protein